MGAIGVSGAKPETDKAIAVKGIENIKGITGKQITSSLHLEVSQNR